jgi:hypothetical protein
MISTVLPSMQQEAMDKWDEAFKPDDQGGGHAR